MRVLRRTHYPELELSTQYYRFTITCSPAPRSRHRSQDPRIGSHSMLPYPVVLRILEFVHIPCCHIQSFSGSSSWFRWCGNRTCRPDPMPTLMPDPKPGPKPGPKPDPKPEPKRDPKPDPEPCMYHPNWVRVTVRVSYISIIPTGLRLVLVI